jgi:hypothetical protein
VSVIAPVCNNDDLNSPPDGHALVHLLSSDAWEWDYQKELNRGWWTLLARHQRSSCPVASFKRTLQANGHNKNSSDEQSDVADAKQSEPGLV